jgi:hypothetical protein
LAGYAAEADAATLGGGANLLTNIIVSMGAGASLGKTVESINLARSAWVTGRKAQKVFRQGIEQAGRGVTSGKWHAHHLVPLGWKSDAAESARERLGHFEIDINSVNNGVGLPASVHKALDHELWSQQVARSLEQAGSRSEALDVLDELALQIQRDPTPFFKEKYR